MTPASRPLAAALLAFFIVAARPSSPSAGLPATAQPWTIIPARGAFPGFGRPASILDVPDLPPGGPIGDSIRLSPEEALRIGRLIWRNESGGTVDGLTHWNSGEAFASLGIAHFIWYPEGRRGPFIESFPGLLSFLLVHDVGLPDWLAEARGCPWPDQAAFLGDFRAPRMRQLRRILARSVDLQARFAAHRLEGALPKILANAPVAERTALKSRFYAVAFHPRGVYALVDYVNFKGEGTSPTERYQGVGWGLLQVLEAMPDGPAGPAAVAEFSYAARRVLERRAQLSPPARGESRWLEGWRKRVGTYLTED